MHTEQVIAAAQAGKHVFCEKPFALTKADADAAVAATQKAGVTLGLGYNRRFHPEMTALRDRIRIRRARHGPALRSDDDVSECAGAEAGSVARGPRRDAVRRADADGRARDRRDDRSRAATIDQVFCQSFRRVVQVDSDDTTSMLFRMKNGMSGYLGHDDGDGPGLQLPGVRLEGVGAARRHDARGGRLVGGTPHAALRHVQVPADQGRGGGVGGRAARRHARVSRRICAQRPPAGTPS